MATPALDDDLRFPKRVEDLAVEEFIAQTRIEALDEAVLPRAARCDIGGPCTDGGDPLLHGLGDELRPVVGADMAGNATQDEEVGERIDDVDGSELPRHPDRQAFMGKLVDDVEHAYLAPVMGPILDEVVGPDVIAVLGPEANAGAVVQPQAAALRLPGRDLQPLAPPDPLHPLVVDEPTGSPQQLGDLAIAVAAVETGQFDDVGCQPLLIIAALRDLALRRAMLAERRTGAALGDGELPSDMLDAGTAARGA
jgi:hypothetical protein